MTMRNDVIMALAIEKVTPMEPIKDEDGKVTGFTAIDEPQTMVILNVLCMSPEARKDGKVVKRGKPEDKSYTNKKNVRIALSAIVGGDKLPQSNIKTSDFREFVKAAPVYLDEVEDGKYQLVAVGEVDEDFEDALKNINTMLKEGKGAKKEKSRYENDL